MRSTIGKVYIGAAGLATEVFHILEVSDPPDLAATLATWFLQCPGQSLAWQHYVLSMIHLRLLPNVKPPVINREGATHEVLLAALDPEGHPKPDSVELWQPLSPVNFVGQLELPSDVVAKHVLELLACSVADGTLWAEPPLSGQRDPWEWQLRQCEAHVQGKHAQ